MLMDKGIPSYVRWIIEAKVRLTGEPPNSFISHMSSMGNSSYARKRIAQNLEVCHKCAR